MIDLKFIKNKTDKIKLYSKEIDIVFEFSLEEIKKDTKAGGEAGVEGTPANFVNGVLYVGALPTATFTQIIDAELTK